MGCTPCVVQPTYSLLVGVAPRPGASIEAMDLHHVEPEHGHHTAVNGGETNSSCGGIRRASVGGTHSQKTACLIRRLRRVSELGNRSRCYRRRPRWTPRVCSRSASRRTRGAGYRVDRSRPAEDERSERLASSRREVDDVSLCDHRYCLPHACRSLPCVDAESLG